MPSVIKCIVQGKRIEEVLRVLKPYALEPPVVDVIDNSATSPAIKPRGDLIKSTQDYITKLSKSGAKTVTGKQIKEFCLNHGSQSNSYVLKKLLENKLLKRTKDKKTYEIVR